VAAVSYSCGGAVSKQHNVPAAQIVVAKDATREELIEKYNLIAKGVNSVNATVELTPTTGSKYSGVIEEYHEVKAFLLAQRPASIRMIGQAPVIGKTVFDMASDAESFQVSIPGKISILSAPWRGRTSSKPIEICAHSICWMRCSDEIRKEEVVLFEEFNDERARYYVLTVVRGGYRTEVLRKIWFDRADLQVARLEEFGPKGILLSDVRYSDWEPVTSDQEHLSGTPSGITSFPRVIRIDRPHDDYRLDLQMTKLQLNEAIPVDRFKLEQPAGSELVRIAEDATEKRP
jgi:hypothetical protein